MFLGAYLPELTLYCTAMMFCPLMLCRESFGLPTIRRGALTHHGNVGGVSTASGTPSYALKESKWISGDVAVGELRDHRMTHSVRRCFRLPTLLFLKYMVCYMVYAC